MPGTSGFQPADLVQERAYTSIGSHDIRFVERPGGVTAPTTSTAWVSGLCVYVPFTLAEPVTTYEWWWINGSATTAHNINFALYNPDFTLIQATSASSTTTTATSLINTSAVWTDLLLTPGQYYMAMLDDSTRNIQGSTDARGLYEAAGLMEQTGLSTTMPSPAVPVIYTRAFCPNFGLNCYTVAL